jgi:choline kinase
MIGIIIAAGMGTRMGKHAAMRPKCMLPVAGRTILDQIVANMRGAGCKRIVAVTGHLADQIDHPDIETVHNADYRNNNILASLMQARTYLDGPVIVSYSDIWVEPPIYARLIDTPGDLVLAVDRDWRPYYENRRDHPIAEAENAFVRRDDNCLAEIGKHLDDAAPPDMLCGEFLGLWRMSRRGTEIFRDAFDALNDKLDPLAPFEHAAEWRKAYITDMIEYLLSRGQRVDCALVERGWAELDTTEDYERLTEIAVRQALSTIVAAGGSQ